MKGISVVLLAEGKTIATTETGPNGNFEITADPGQYDVVISRSIFQKSKIANATLHSGDQIIQPLRLGFDRREVTYSSTVGVLVVSVHYPVSYLFKHPIRYLRNIRHQL